MKCSRLIYGALLLAIGTTAAAQSAPAHEGLQTPELVSLSLDDCLDMAREKSASMRNARLDVVAASEQKKELLWEYFPSATAFAGAFASLNPMVEINVRDVLGDSDMAKDLSDKINSEALAMGINPVYSILQKGTLATVNFVQPIFAGGRIVNGNRLASLGVEAARLKESVSDRETGEKVEESWYRIMSLSEKEKTLEQAIALVDNIIADLDAAASAGLASPSDLLLARSRKSSLEVDRLRVGNGILLSRMELFNLIGLDYCVLPASASASRPYLGDIALACCDFGNEDGKLPAPEDCWRPEEEICASLAETRLLDLSARAKALEKKIALGEALPQLGVGASYGYNNLLGHNSLNGTVYASVSVPITQWGKTAHKIRRLDAQLQQAENDRLYLSEQLLLMVRKTWLDLQTAWLQLEAAGEAEAAADERLGRIHADYEAGLATLTELLEAQMNLRSATDSLADLRCAYLQALSAYRRLLPA